ncbi:9908_t:CDS:1, partial [Racocetra fulgida]
HEILIAILQNNSSEENRDPPNIKKRVVVERVKQLMMSQINARPIIS